MKLTIKTLQQHTFKVDIDADKTVKELKDTIEKDHGKDYPSSAQKLIYSGKILADESKLSEYDVDEKKFIVLMITRPPVAPKAPVAEKSSTSSSSSSTVTKKDEPTISKPSASTADDKSSTTSATVNATNTTSRTTEGSAETTSTTTNTTSTTQATNDNNSPSQNVARPTATRPSEAPSPASSLLANEPQMASRLAALMAQPQFRQIQDLIQQSPHLLSSTIEALASSDPEMYSFISENPDVFVSVLNHPPLAGSRTQSSGQQPSSRSGTASGQQGSIPQHPSGRQQPVLDQILGNVSEHDKEAIERLKELGFSEIQAVQAYMACDKDEQLAANLLFQMD